MTNWTIDTAISAILSLPADTIKVVAFSGGKDSTALLGLMLEANNKGLQNWRVINSDTLMEIPFLVQHIDECESVLRDKGIEFDRVVAPMRSRFFYSLIGKGVPSPTRSFRWCTQALKIKPQQTKLKEFKNYILLTGERLGESKNRDKKLKGCDGSNECGIPELKNTSISDNIERPLLNASTCDVWDTIALFDIEKNLLAGSFNRLNNVYSINDEDNSQSLRTGCIGCPLVKKDKSLEKLIVVYEGYKPLSRLRSLYDLTRLEQNRIMRPDLKGKGAVRLDVRKRLWEEILEIELQVRESFPDFILVQEEEKDAIEKALDQGQYPTGYTKQHITEQGG